MRIRTLVAALTLIISSLSFAHGNLAEVVARGERVHALEMIEQGTVIDALLSDGTSALLYAAYQGDAELVNALLEAGAEVNLSNEYGAYALSEATIQSNNEVIALLLTNGANPNHKNSEGETSLMVAARTGNLEGAELLLDHHADVNATESWGGQSALMWASAQKHPEMMSLLIAHGADVNAQGAIRLWDRRITSEPRPKDMNKGGFSALHYAARQACIDCIEVLVDANANLDSIDPDRVTPLNLALINQHFDTAAALIEAGANVNKWDIFGRAPLFNAVDLNSLPTGGRTDIPSDDALTGVDIARMLLERGANPNMQLKLRPPYRNVPFDRGADNIISTGASPLMMAARTADNESIALLIEYGALVNLPNARGQTAIMVASGMNYPSNPTRGRFKTEAESIESIRLLLESGADINAITGDPSIEVDPAALLNAQRDFIGRGSPRALNFGQTALHSAAQKGWNDIAQFLIDNGAIQQAKDSRGYTPIDLALGDFSAGFLEAPPEANIDTVKLLQENCLATDNCTLERVFDFNDE